MSFFQVGWSPVMKNKSEVLALKYRPQIFEDLIGQKEIAETIFNAINLNKSSNAYLFTGIRGVGKTTFARIVAKALNCKKGVENLCAEEFCDNCKSIINSNHIDVLEIDAASRTGVDDVRELIEFSRYPPSIAKFKIFIIDEVHMLSKQAFNALLKTLEEPPNYLKFIFATTEVKKIPITVVSRCQRYDLTRVKSDELFEFLKNICDKEKKKADENAIKLIVKISEGSVRDALSLLDRAIISTNQELLSFKNVQEIFGYVDKSSYIDLLELVFKGDEVAVLNHYKNLYNSGVEPNNFLNEFLEILYFVKNISNIKSQGKSFTLNDSDHRKILSLSNKLKSSDILLFWQFTLKTIQEINLVSNPNLSIEMFLIQLIYLIQKDLKSSNYIINSENKNYDYKEVKNKKNIDVVNQLKSIKQEEESIEKKNKEKLSSLDDIIQMCLKKKEMKLKYELENNTNLVSFSEKRIEISFNEKLSKNFVKDLSEKLFNWTNERWIISFSKEQGEKSEKEKQKNYVENKINKFKNSDDYIELLKLIPDIDLINIKKKND